MAKAKNETETIVNQLGDVTEREMVVGPVSGELIPVQPLSELPDDAKALAQVYPNAKGFTAEGGSIALHF